MEQGGQGRQARHQEVTGHSPDPSPATQQGGHHHAQHQASQATDAFLSKPQMYGGFGGFPRDVKFVRRQRQRMNLVSVCQCIFVPWLFFCAMYATVAFHIHHTRPWLCWVIVGVGALIVLACGGLAARQVYRKHQRDLTAEPSWSVFFFLMMLIALAVGAVLGNLNFWLFMEQYYDYSYLDIYHSVNPARTRGQQLMDAGRVNFLPSTTIDTRRSMAFKNQDTYCVAPITIKGPAGGVLASYDYWAVGLNCCSDVTAQFQCGDYDNPLAHGGLRALSDEQRQFYRLAVQQAEAMYQIKATHPLFFYWTQDPDNEMMSWRNEGYRYFLIAMLVHFCWQLLTVILASLGFAKMGHY